MAFFSEIRWNEGLRDGALRAASMADKDSIIDWPPFLPWHDKLIFGRTFAASSS